MNQDIYNKNVASFTLNLKELERDILESHIPMETILDFNHFFRRVKTILTDYETLYKDMNNEVSRSQLLEYLEDENDFLVLLVSLLNKLEHYHHTVGFVSNQEIASEWKDVQNVLKGQTIEKDMRSYFYQTAHTKDTSYSMEPLMDMEEKLENLEANESFNRIQELGSATERVLTNVEASDEQKNKIKMVQENLKQQGKVLETIVSIDHFMDKEDVLEESKEERKVSPEEVELDMEYLDHLLLPDKITYLQTILSNIEKMSGKKRAVKYKGVQKRISSKYVGRWLKCQTLLNKYQEVNEEQLEEITSNQEEINEQMKRIEYANLYADFKEIEKALFQLSKKGSHFVNTNQVIAVASFNKEPLYILKEDLDVFNKIFMNYKRMQKSLNEFASQNNIDVLDTDEKVSTLEDLQNKYYKEIYSLQNAPATYDTQEKISVLKKKLYRLNKGKKFAIFANIKVMFKSLALTNDIQEFLEKTMEEPEQLIESKEIRDEQKKKVFEQVLEKSDAYQKENSTKKNTLLDQTVEKVKKCFNKLPKDPKKVAIIKNIKESKNKKALIGAVASAAAVGMVLLGTKYLADTNSVGKPIEKTSTQEETLLTSVEKVSINKMESDKKTTNLYDLSDLFQEEETSPTKKEEPSVETTETEQPEKAVEEQKESEWSYLDVLDDNVDFGDSFTAGDTIYTNQDDLAKEENGVATYFDALSKREVAGIVYNYNGETITIFDTDVDAEAKKQALENNGAKQIGYVGRNELASSNGYEGFFAEEDASFLNSMDEEVTRGGR